MTDAIILAGGNGSRLKGIAATGMKPLLVVNGEALISRLAQQVVPLVDRVIIVTSPQNTQAICDLVITRNTHFVVQPEPRGPGDALLRGLVAARGSMSLVLMGDNWMELDDIKRVAFTESDMAVGVMSVASYEQAQRFTRVRHVHDGFGPILESEEGPNITFDVPCLAWCGPLLLPREDTQRVLDEVYTHADGERMIGSHLGKIASDRDVEFVVTNARDIGIPEAL